MTCVIHIISRSHSSITIQIRSAFDQWHSSRMSFVVVLLFDWNAFFRFCIFGMFIMCVNASAHGNGNVNDSD